ncbi:MAG: hypothetical protein EOL87_02845 [Spartobacteria bacterium]|nr:hypothetical protein [Spartobacteria bacterium]
MRLLAIILIMGTPVWAADILWTGGESTTLTGSTKVGDLVDFEIQTYPADTTGNGAELIVDWLYNGSFSANNTYSMTDNGLDDTNRVWLVSQRMLYAGEQARRYRAYSPDIYTPSTQWTFTVQDLPGPTDCLATNSGDAESITGSWTKDAAYQVMVVRRAGNVPDAPVPQTSYAQGDTYGTDLRNTVVRPTSSDGTFTDMELLPDTTYYYAFFSVNNGCFASNIGDVASGAAMSATTASFLTNRLAGDSFSYFSGQSLDGLSHGMGWSNDWSSTGGFTVNNQSFDNWSGFPANQGGKLRINPASDSSYTAYRSFDMISTGTIYAVFMMNYELAGTGNFVGMSFMSNETERAFFGEISESDQRLGLASYDDVDSYVDSGVALSAGSGNSYLVIGKFDFATRTLQTKAYASGAAVPATEPTSWDASAVLDAGRMDGINGIRIGVGEADSGTSGTPGNTYLDEFHVAQSWVNLVSDKAEVVTTRPPPPIFFLQGLR